MARSDLLLALVRAGTQGDKPVFRKTVEAIVAEERQKRHTVLADQLTALIVNNGHSTNGVAPSNNGSSRSEMLFHELAPKRRLDDLILSEPVATACREMIEEQNRCDLLRSHALEPRNRMLLVGPPGNGKTTLAEGIAESLAVPLIVPRYELLIGSYLGETAARLARVVEYARSRPCVLFFDEFDTLGKERGDRHETGEIKRVVSSLLLQMDSLPPYVVLIAATNHAELLDRAAWRRFQLRLELAPPTKVQRVEWLTRFASSRGINWGITPSKIAERLSATSFAELEQFGLDVLRQHVLSLPDSDIGRIVQTRLQQWKLRQAVKDGAHDSEVAD
jgi:SpoVK/Ycf46/Vps4 family AAA+-type ATPase